MTLMFLCLIPAVVLAFVTRRRRHLVKRKLTRGPLAGYDTGVRSAFRTPGKFIRQNRGF